ncbi:hypothetical protein [Macrococcus capreoli]|uniref:hypothetical protein n=1 Tax=Macrococcus capreoli TaxID=2982690 RepID=UPI003F424D98
MTLIVVETFSNKTIDLEVDSFDGYSLRNELLDQATSHVVIGGQVFSRLDVKNVIEKDLINKNV